jgi:hypothetical protein
MGKDEYPRWAEWLDSCYQRLRDFLNYHSTAFVVLLVVVWASMGEHLRARIAFG